MNIQDFKNLFIPCAENKFKPDFLERASMGIMLFLVLLSFAIANIQSLVWIGSDWMVSTVLPAVIVDLTNDERDNQKLTSLKRSDILDAAATLKAEDMAKKGYFAHHSPDGISPWHWFDEVSYNYVYAGENLAVHFTDSHEVVEAWMKSPAHRENIMNGTFAEIGVGTAKGTYKGAPTIFVVQLFGTQSGTPKANTQVVEAVPSATIPPENEISEPIAIDSPEGSSVLSENIALENDAVEDSPTLPSAETSDIYTAPEVIQEEVIDDVDEPRSFEVAEMEKNSVLYSDLATTSRPDALGFMSLFGSDASDSGNENELNPFEKSATHPGLWLQIVYATLAFIVVCALLLSILIEWRKQHPIQIMYAGGLLAVMALLFHTHTLLTHGVLII